MSNADSRILELLDQLTGSVAEDTLIYLRESFQAPDGDLAVHVEGDVEGDLNVARQIIELEVITQQVSLDSESRRMMRQLITDLRAQAGLPPDTQKLPRLFVSYAHDDDPEFVERLVADLTHAGFEVWWDRTHLASRGIPLPQELRRAIMTEVDHVLMVVGPNASRKGQTKDTNLYVEWQTTRQSCLAVSAVLRSGEPELLLPEWRSALYYDFREDANYQARLEELSTKLQISPIPPGKLVNVPLLPDHFLPRPEDTDHIQSLLNAGSVTISGNQRKVSLKGMGGIGKSMIAAAVAHECAVRRVYPDGVYWLTIGQHARNKLLELVAELCTSISGQRQVFKTAEAVSLHLSDLLTDRACLIILDDVWDRADAAVFDVMGDQSRLLITTRIQNLIDGAQEHSVEVLSDEQAYQLIKKRTGKDDEGYYQIAEHLGNLPLALDLAGAQLAKGGTVEQWLARFDRVSRIKAGRNERGRDMNLQACFEASVATFAEDGDDPLLYHLLGIFPENEGIPEQVVLRLWGAVNTEMDEVEGTEIIDELERLALIGRDRIEETITVHDLLHDYNAEQLGEAYGSYQSALLDSYNPDNRGWYEIADDGYVYDHLAYHLKEAARLEDIQALFANDQWMHVRIKQSGNVYTGFIADLMLAWADAHQEVLRQIEAGDEPTTLPDCVHYALIRTSLNSLSSNYTPELVARAVLLNVWTLEQALALADTMPDPSQKVRLYDQLIATGQLDDVQRSDAIEAALTTALCITSADERVYVLSEIVDKLEAETRQAVVATILEGVTDQSVFGEFVTANTLVALAMALPEDERYQVMVAALNKARAISSDSSRASSLGIMAPQLPGDLQHEALQAALDAIETMQVAKEQADSLERLANLVDGQLFSRTLDITLALADEGQRARVLARLIDRLSEAQTGRVLDMVRSFQYVGPRAWMFGLLAQKLDGPERRELQATALEDAQRIAQADYRAWVMSQLAETVDAETRPAVIQAELAAALMIEDELYRVRALIRVASRLDADQLPGVLDAVLVIQRNDACAEGLKDLAPLLSQSQVAKALTAALILTDEGPRSMALIGLVEWLDDSQIESVLDVALSTQETWPRSNLLVALAPRLTASQLQKALDATSSINDAADLVQTLIYLAEQWNEPTIVTAALSHALAIALTIPEAWTRSEVLGELADRLQGAERLTALDVALQAVMERPTEMGRAMALDELVPHLPDSHIAAALQLALSIESSRWATWALRSLPPRLNQAQSQSVVQALLEMPSGGDREAILAALIEKLPKADQNAVKSALQTSLDSVLAIESEYERAMALSAMDWLRDPWMQTALEAVLEFEQEPIRAFALALLAENLEGHQLSQALAAARTMHDPAARDRAMDAIVEVVEGDVLKQATQLQLAWAFEARSEAERVQALHSLVGRLDDSQIGTVLETLPTLEDPFRQANLIDDLAPHLTGDQIEVAFDLTLDHKDPYAQAAMFKALAPFLDDRQVEKAYETARGMPEVESRAKALMALASRLTESQIAVTLEAILAASSIWRRREFLIELAPYVSGAQVGRIVNVVRDDMDEWERTSILEALADSLEEGLVQDVLEDALAMSDVYYGNRILVALAPHLNSTQGGLVLQRIQVDDTSWTQRENLISFAQAITGEFQQEVLQMVIDSTFAVQDDDDRRRWQTALIDHLSAEQRLSLFIRELFNAQNNERGDIVKLLSSLIFPVAILPPSMMRSVIDTLGAIGIGWRWT